MHKNFMKSIFYYGMIGILGIAFLFVGIVFQSEIKISNRLIWGGIGLLIIGLLFMVITLLVMKRPIGEKGFKRLSDTNQDERSKFIVGKSSNITLDFMYVISMIACGVFTFLGMNSFVFVCVGYMVISSTFQFGISMYLQYKF